MKYYPLSTPCSSSPAWPLLDCVDSLPASLANKSGKNQLVLADCIIKNGQWESEATESISLKTHYFKSTVMMIKRVVHYYGAPTIG